MLLKFPLWNMKCLGVSIYCLLLDIVFCNIYFEVNFSIISLRKKFVWKSFLESTERCFRCFYFIETQGKDH